MFTKFYWGLWAALGIITAGMAAVGELGWLGISVVGFISCLLIFMGMICVTPTIVGPHAAEYQHADAEPVMEKERTRRSIREAVAPAAVAVQNRHA